MGMWISVVLLALVEWSLELTRLGGGLLCLVAAALFVRRFATSRKGVPVVACVLAGIGVCVLGMASAAIWAGEETGVF